MRANLYNPKQMSRLLALVGAGLVFTLLLGIIVVFSIRSPSETDFHLARVRALLDSKNYIEALRVLGNPSGPREKQAETHSYRGAAYLRLHLYETAIEEFQAAIDKRARQSDPWIGLASTYMELGETRKAREQADRATNVDGRSADAWIMLGRALWLEGSLKEAEEAALKAEKLAPASSPVEDLLLHIYFDQNRVDEFQKVLDRSSNASVSKQELAVRFYIRQGQFVRAWDLKSRWERADRQRSVLELELALNRDSRLRNQYPLLISNLVKVGRFEDAINAGNAYRGSGIDLEMGKAYWMTGQLDQAIQAFTRASQGLVHKLSAEVALAIITGDIRHWRQAFKAERIEQDYFILSQLEAEIPRSSSVVSAFIYRYAALFESSLYNRAVEAAQKALNDDPLNPDALLTISTAYQRLGQVDDARRMLDLASREYPESAEVWSRLGNLALASGDRAKVLQLMEKAVELDPANAGYLYNLGWLYDQLGNTGRAVELYDQAIRRSPLSFEAMNNLALIYGQSGEPARALRLLEQAIETDPESEIAYFNLASHHTRQREWSQALRRLDQALLINPANAIAGVEKGRIQLELGRLDDATESLNRALDADVHSLDAYMLLATAYERNGHTAEAAGAPKEAERIRARTESSQ